MFAYILSAFLLFSPITSTITSSTKVPEQKNKVVYRSSNLIIKKIGPHTYQHISYLQTESFGNVECNGMIATDLKEAIIFDTPANDAATEELIRYLKKKHYTIKAVVATHFHGDCVAGLAVFHQHSIPSYAYYKTREFLIETKSKFALPQNSFNDSLELKLGDKKVTAAFYGEGHTKDNVIGYFPADNIMFGGCLVKEVDAGKGFLDDANVDAWPETIRTIKAAYPSIKLIIPGHGETGGVQLLDYTIQLFKK